MVYDVLYSPLRYFRMQCDTFVYTIQYNTTQHTSHTTPHSTKNILQDRDSDEDDDDFRGPGRNGGRGSRSDRSANNHCDFLVVYYKSCRRFNDQSLFEITFLLIFLLYFARSSLFFSAIFSLVTGNSLSSSMVLLPVIFDTLSYQKVHFSINCITFTLCTVLQEGERGKTGRG